MVETEQNGANLNEDSISHRDKQMKHVVTYRQKPSLSQLSSCFAPSQIAYSLCFSYTTSEFSCWTCMVRNGMKGICRWEHVFQAVKFRYIVR